MRDFPYKGLLKNTEYTRFKSIDDVPCYRCRGVYDLIVLVEADSQDNLKQVIQQRIRSLDAVHGIITMVVCPGA